MSRVYETRFLGQNKLYECKSRLNENVWQSKQKWNCYECWCECKFYMTGVLIKGVICVILIRVAASAISHLKFMKNCSCENV